jgi:glucokinase
MTEPGYVIAIDLGGTKILSLCVDRDLKVVGNDLRATEADQGRDAVIDRMVASAKAAAGERSVLGIGVSCPGPSDPKRGIITTPPNLPGWHNVPLADLIKQRAGIPAWIENDANAGALAEYRLGAGRGTMHLILVAAGTGIGGRLVLDGRLYHGASGGAGELGHMQLDPRGRMCNCGRRGCLEALASGSALDAYAREIAQGQPDGLVAQIARREGEEPSARILDLATAAGDGAAREALERAGGYLGSGLTNLVDLFNPDVIAIGGSLRKSEVYMKTALAVPPREAFPQHAADVRIVEAELGDEAPAMGAAIIAWEMLEKAQQS